MEQMVMTSGSNDLEERLSPLRNYVANEMPSESRRQAAILIPVLRSTHQLIYTLRSMKLSSHRGEISFPGGMIESGEEPLNAALREAHEEIGLPPNKVEMIGRIDDLVTTRGVHVRCYAAICDEFEPQINTSEVERLVEVEIDELFDTSIHERKPWGSRPAVHYFNFNHGVVWGATGYITYRLREVLKCSNN